MRITKRLLEKTIAWAIKRETADDHLDRGERLSVIHAYKTIHPEAVLPTDVDLAFVEVIS